MILKKRNSPILVDKAFNIIQNNEVELINNSICENIIFYFKNKEYQKFNPKHPDEERSALIFLIEHFTHINYQYFHRDIFNILTDKCNLDTLSHSSNIKDSEIERFFEFILENSKENKSTILDLYNDKQSVEYLNKFLNSYFRYIKPTESDINIKFNSITQQFYIEVGYSVDFYRCKSDKKGKYKEYTDGINRCILNISNSFEIVNYSEVKPGRYAEYFIKRNIMIDSNKILPILSNIISDIRKICDLVEDSRDEYKEIIHIAS